MLDLHATPTCKISAEKIKDYGRAWYNRYAAIPSGAQDAEAKPVKTGSFVDFASNSTLSGRPLGMRSSSHTLEKRTEPSSESERTSSEFPAGIADR